MIHPFSLILLAYTGYTLFQSGTLKEKFIAFLAMHVFVYMNVEAGAFLSIGSGIKYNFYTEFICLILALFFIIKKSGEIDAGSTIKLFLALSALFVGLLGLKLWPLQKYMVTGDMLIDDYWFGNTELQLPALRSYVTKTLIQYLIFLTILYGIYLSFRREDYEALLDKCAKWCKVAVIFGWVEFLIKNLTHSNVLFSLNNLFFGYNEAVFPMMEKRGILFRLSGFTTEAAHFSYAMLLVAFLFLANYQLGKMSLHWAIQAFLLMLLSMSFSSVVFALAFLAIFFISRYRKNIRGEKIFQIFLWCLLAFSILYIIYRSGILDSSYFGKRMKAVFDDWGLLFIDVERVRDIPYQSSRVRLISSFSTLALLRFRPFFGIGIGTTSSHGSFSSILSGMGILGTLSWLLMLFYGRAAKLIRHYGSAYFLMILLWCITGIFNGHFWGMFYNAENYALMISFLVLSRRGERA